MTGAVHKKKGNSREIKVVNVTSRLSKLGLSPGGISRDDALEKANTAIESLRTDYPEWLERDLATLQELILTIDAKSGDAPEELEEIYRKAAQIRDLGTSFDFPLVTIAADSLCELIYRLKESSAYDSQSIDYHIKALRYLKRPKSQTDQDDRAMPLVRGLKMLVERHKKPKRLVQKKKKTGQNPAKA